MKPPRAKWTVAFPREFVLNPALKPAEKQICYVLAEWCDRNLVADCTKEQISEGANLSVRQIWFHLESLRKKGFISWTKKRYPSGLWRNLYRLEAPCGNLILCWVPDSMRKPHGSPQKIYPFSPHTSKSPKIIDIHSGEHVAGWFPIEDPPSTVQETAQ